MGQILNNNPNVTTESAFQIATKLKKYQEVYQVPAAIMSAIFMTESSYKLGAVNKKSKDYGIGQVSIWHVRNSNLSTQRLLTDLDYSVDQSFKVFKWFYDRYPLEEAVARYNCGTKTTCPDWKSVKRYKRKVISYL